MNASHLPATLSQSDEMTATSPTTRPIMQQLSTSHPCPNSTLYTPRCMLNLQSTIKQHSYNMNYPCCPWFHLQKIKVKIKFEVKIIYTL